jgi:4-amino-4-deoxy-L-arabinose transferase-like glycosyltransferase
MKSVIEKDCVNQPVQFWNRPFLWALIIFMAYGFGLWWYSVPFTGDEKVYLATAMEMWISKSWLYPILFGEHSYYKPPLQYWGMLLSWRIFGFGNFGAYFPSVIATSGTALLLMRIRKLLMKNRLRQDELHTSFTTVGIWFAACTGTLTYGTTAQMEIWLVFFYMAVGWALLNYLKSKNWLWLYGALSFAGISSLVKSPLYSIFSVISIWIFLILTKNFTLFKKFHFWLAHCWGICIGAWWYLIIFLTDRDRFIGQYFYGETLSKWMGNSSSALKMWSDFTLFCIPFLLFIIPAVWLSLSKLRRIAYDADKNFERDELTPFITAFAAAPAIFFSFFPYRTETYLYLLLPLMVLWIDHTINVTKITLITSRLNGVLVFLLALGASLLFVSGGLIPIVLGIPLLISGGLFFFYSWNVKWHAMAITALLMITLIRLSATSLGESDIKVLKTLIATSPERELSFYDEGKNIWNEIGLLAVGVGKPANRCITFEEAVSTLKSGAFLVLNDVQIGEFFKKLKTLPLPEGKLQITPWQRWKRGFVVPSAKDLIQIGYKASPLWEERNRRGYNILYLTN